MVVQVINSSCCGTMHSTGLCESHAEIRFPCNLLAQGTIAKAKQFFLSAVGAAGCNVCSGGRDGMGVYLMPATVPL